MNAAHRDGNGLQACTPSCDMPLVTGASAQLLVHDIMPELPAVAWECIEATAQVTGCGCGGGEQRQCKWMWRPSFPAPKALTVSRDMCVLGDPEPLPKPAAGLLQWGPVAVPQKALLLYACMQHQHTSDGIAPAPEAQGHRQRPALAIAPAMRRRWSMQCCCALPTHSCLRGAMWPTVAGWVGEAP